MNQPNQCPRCGTPLPENAPLGLCPKCLMRAAIESQDSGADSHHDETAASQNRFDPPTTETLEPLFPHLEIQELLGQGGMGAVYRAKQTKLDRLVALKIIRPEAAEDQAFAQRFNREARTLARLNHPNIVSVHDFGEVDFSEEANAQGTSKKLYYFVMEYVDGTNLRQLIQAQSLQPAQALAIVPQICEALQFAHDTGVVHRDIKPENVLVDTRGRVKIADFGLAKLASGSEHDFTLTGTHQVMGTPRYMAPEQMEGSHAVDHRADIYSLGVVFYEMLTGQVPAGHFDPPSQKVEVDVRLDEVVLRTLAREPDRRYQQASEVKTDVDTIASDERDHQQSHSAHDSHHHRQHSSPTHYGFAQYTFMFLLLIGGSWLMSIAMRDYFPPPSINEQNNPKDQASVERGDVPSDSIVPGPQVTTASKDLWNAIQFGDNESVIKLLHSGVDPNEQEPGGVSPLMLASAMGHLEIVKSLIEAGADVNAREGGHGGMLQVKSTPDREHPDFVYLRYPQQTALFNAIQYKQEDVVKLLLDSGADPRLANSSGDSALDHDEKTNYGNFGYLLRPAARKVAEAAGERYELRYSGSLESAALNGDIDEILRLLKENVDVDGRHQFGHTALMQAAMNGHLRAMLLLIMNGADEKATDNRGRTPLMYAAESGQSRAVELLTNLEVVSYLDKAQAFMRRIDGELFAEEDAFEGLSFEIDIDARDDNGETALMKAAAGGHYEATQMLLRSSPWPSADTTIQDKSGRTALVHAIECGRKEFLLQSLADPDGSESHRSYVTLPAIMSFEVLQQSSADGLSGWDLLVAGDFVEVVDKLQAKLKLMIDHDTRRIPEADVAELPYLHRNRGEVWRLLGETEKAEADLAEFNKLDSMTEGTTAAGLFVAASAGDLDRIRSILKDDKSLLGSTDQEGRNALMHAAAGGHIDCIKYLSAHENMVDGPRISPRARDKRGRTAFAHAVLAGQTALVQDACRIDSRYPAVFYFDLPDFCSSEVLSMRDGDGKTVLQLAEEGGHEKIATIIRDACEATIDRMTTWLVNDSIAASAKNVPLNHRAHCWEAIGEAELAAKDRKWAAWYNDSHFDKRSGQILSLMEASVTGQTDQVKAALADGIDPNVTGPDGETALMKAAASGQLRSVVVLLLRGANEQEQDERGQTPLMHAAAAGQSEIVEWFLELDKVHYDEKLQFRLTRLDSDLPADTDFAKMRFDVGEALQDKLGDTALMKAAAAGHTEATISLANHLNSGLHAMKDNAGRTALMKAVEAGHDEMLAAVAQQGGFSRHTSGFSVSHPSRLFYSRSYVTDKPDVDGLSVMDYLEKHQMKQTVAALRAQIEKMIQGATRSIDDPAKPEHVLIALRDRAGWLRALGETEKADADDARIEKLNASATE